ncbi:MAG: MBG domain-containing protein, partial [Bacteroidota bacterium]|nr:MBG domain-containing protein [Bacteroidota bacterium]
GNNYVAAAESALNLKPYVGSNDTIDVFSNLDWISVVIPSWLSFTPESGNGNGTINVATAEVNNTGAPRSARINIGGKNIENHTHVVITQEAGKLSVNCNEIFLSQKADSWANFYIYSNTKWTISKSCDWLRVAKESGIGDVGNALITLSENTTGTFRTATVTITAEGANPQIIKVTQLGAAQISLSASPVSLAFGKEANNHASFDVFSNSIWQITGVPQWLKLSTTADTGNVAITATTLEANSQIFKRSATLTLSAPGTSPVPIYVLQEASEPYLTVSPATAKMLASGSATDLLIKSNTSWTAFPGKRIVLDKLSGSGDDTLKLTVPANAFPYCYKDSIRFHPLEGEDRYVTIIQDTLQGYISRPPIAGDGSDSNPYRISTLEQLYWIAENPVRWSYHYVQIKDIDAGSTSTWFNHHGWPGIGNAGIPFTGSYDGLGHTISGIHINHDADENVGFFGYIKGATIKNLGLATANVVGLKSTGRMAGFNQGIIENCFAAGTISGGQATGGFVGSNSGTVKNCFSFCTDKYTGGAISGGFVGENFSGGVIQYCYTSDVVAASNCNSGSFAGDIYPGSMITYCHWLSTNPGLGLDRGGMFENNSGLSTNDMRLQASFPNWDFLNESANGTDDIWGFYPSLYNGYPCLVWQLLPEVSTDSISHVDKNSAVVHAHIKLGLNRTQDAYGVCWNTTGNPTVADPKTNNGYFSENRAYADTVRSLKGNVTYYARAYATGTYGTVYGKEMSFTTILHPLAINPPQVELTKIYDGTASAQITSMGTISGIKNNDDIRVSATANYDNANVAKDKTLIITYTLSGSAGNFYDAPVNDTIYNGEITARPIKVTVDPDQTKVYGEPDPVFLYSYSPELINGDVFKGALSRVTGENVGNYMIEKGSLSAGDNYHVDFIPGNFTITRKLLTCNSLIITDSKVYDGTTAVAFTPGPVTGIKAGDE